MMRRCVSLKKVSRSWSKVRGVSGHFPLAAADPALQRDTSCSAKEQKVFLVTKDGMPGQGAAASVMKGLRGWAELVELKDVSSSLLSVVPLLWGASIATTRALVYEGADPIVLCSPFVPIHLLVSFTLGAFTMRSGAVALSNSNVKGGGMCPKAAAISVSHLTTGMLCALNLSPSAALLTASLIPIGFLWGVFRARTEVCEPAILASAAIAPLIGYAAVLNRVDFVPCLCLSSAACTAVFISRILSNLQRGDKQWAHNYGKTMMSGAVFPLAISLTLSGFAAPQSLFFYFGVGLSVYYLTNVIDHVNVFDVWSSQTAFRRTVKGFWFIFLAMIVGNTFWAYASEYEADKDVQSISTSALSEVLFLQNRNSIRMYDVSSFSWLDRFLKPAYVQSQVLGGQGVAESDIVIPPWMRREYFGENVAHIVRYLGGSSISEETIKSWELWWYSIVDHYNILSHFSQ